MEQIDQRSYYVNGIQEWPGRTPAVVFTDRVTKSSFLVRPEDQSVETVLREMRKKFAAHAA